MATTINEYIAGLDTPRKEVAERLEELLDAGLPDLDAKLWQAQPVWMQGKTPVAGFKAFPRWVTLMIWRADGIEDSSGRLQIGPRMGTVKLSNVAEVDDALFAEWIRQVVVVTANEG